MSDFPFGAAAPSGRSPPFFLPTPFFGDEYWMVLLPASWTVTRSATKSKSRKPPVLSDAISKAIPKVQLQVPK
ncbi:uncharacterized protein ARMOST_01769 [Armillaria ostoyae]|uniref:Uncharacterized protein n=1 Tax=Armillaria ostoyae TaxID=47428 RepID=A0A284QPZ2_ARMOS|nr:uncharacterized protein ARMOST_01769 [Armillaria ostoyae]